LKSDWQRHVLASSGYLELGMFDDAAMVLEEIAPEDKNRNEVLGARVNLYMAAKKWDMAAAVASHLVKVYPQTAGWWLICILALLPFALQAQQSRFGEWKIDNAPALTPPAPSVWDDFAIASARASYVFQTNGRCSTKVCR
jgi:hypothetical protein